MSDTRVSVVVTGTVWMGSGIGSIESALERLFREAEVTTYPRQGTDYYSVNYETYICDGVEYPQIRANEVIIGPHIQPAGYFSNPAKLKKQP